MKKDPYDFIASNAFGQPVEQKPEFDQLEAMELYCPECGRAVPVRKSLLLVLPQGDKYEYRCRYCGATVGDKIDKSGQFQGIIET